LSVYAQKTSGSHAGSDSSVTQSHTEISRHNSHLIHTFTWIAKTKADHA